MVGFSVAKPHSGRRGGLHAGPRDRVGGRSEASGAGHRVRFALRAKHSTRAGRYEEAVSEVCREGYREVGLLVRAGEGGGDGGDLLRFLSRDCESDAKG